MGIRFRYDCNRILGVCVWEGGGGGLVREDYVVEKITKTNKRIGNKFW